MSDTVKPTQVSGGSAPVLGVDPVPASVAPRPIPPEPAWMGKDTSSSKPAAELPSAPKQNFYEGNQETSSGKGKKVLSTIGVVLGMVLLASLSFFSLWFLTAQKAKDKGGVEGTGIPGLVSMDEKDLQLKAGEKDEVASWKSLIEDTTSVSDEQKLNIVGKVLSWLDDQRDSRDFYIFGYSCPLIGNCSQQTADNRVGLAAIWGRFLYYQKTNNSNDLVIIDKDIDNYTDPQKVSVIQNNFWNCKLMYELYQSDLLASDKKQKIKNICTQSIYNPSYLKETESGKNDLQEIINNLAEIGSSFQAQSNKGAEFTELSAYSSDFTARYLWDKNEEDLNRAKALFNKAIVLWKNEPRTNYLEGKCLLGIAALDLYTAIQDKDYLDFAASFIDKERIKDFCLTPEAEGSNYYNSSIFEHATCGIFANQLNKLKQDTKYQELKDSLIANAVGNLLNYPQYADGEGKSAFFNQIGANEQITISKPVRENGLMVGLLMMK